MNHSMNTYVRFFIKRTCLKEILEYYKNFWSLTSLIQVYK